VVVLVVLVVAAAGVVETVGQGVRSVDPRRGFCFFVLFQKSLPRAISALGTHVSRGIDLPLGIWLFAGPAVPSAMCREFPLGKGCAESKGACAESISLLAKAANLVVTAATLVIGKAEVIFEKCSPKWIFNGNKSAF
jgi:hypothetical protein